MFSVADPHVLVLTGSSQGSEMSVGALIISVVVVISLALLAIAAYMVFKRRRIYNIRGYYRHGDEDEEEEMTVVVPA
jgi:flagellar basal body-associated protein FliL